MLVWPAASERFADWRVNYIYFISLYIYVTVPQNDCPSRERETEAECMVRG